MTNSGVAAGEVGGVPLPARPGPSLGLQFPVDAHGGPGELDAADLRDALAKIGSTGVH